MDLRLKGLNVSFLLFVYVHFTLVYTIIIWNKIKLDFALELFSNYTNVYLCTWFVWPLPSLPLQN